MKKFFKFLLPAILVITLMFSLCACGKQQEVVPQVGGESNVGGGSGIIDTEDSDNITEETKPTVNIHAIKLKENEGVNSEGVVFDKTLKFNKYTFVLPCQLDEFLTNTNSTLKNPDILSNISKDKTIEAECYTEYNGKTTDFSITIGKDLDGNNCVVGFRIKSDNRISGNMEGTPNLVSCGFEFLGCDMDNSQLLNIDKKFIPIAEYKENDDKTKSYILTLETARGDHWKMTIFSTSNPTVEYYFIDEVVITTIK